MIVLDVIIYMNGEGIVIASRKTTTRLRKSHEYGRKVDGADS